jgi:hypothetical protein
VLQGCASTGETPNNSIPGEVLCSEGNYQWVINIGGLVASSPESAGMGHYKIRGGLVVPLYVIVLALIGSAVSMTRRVPEYQRRAMDVQEALTNVKAREDLVFQIMQVVSAPLIAITVYYILKPGTPTESAVLGFGSGFASEPILLMIRSLVEKLSPAETARQTPVSVRVDPASFVLAPGETKQFAARVLGSSNSDVSWSIDPPDVKSGTISQSGYYASPSIDPGKTVTITARSVADPTKSGNASIIVKAKDPDQQASATIRVNPSSVTLKSEQTQQFNAEISGSSNPAVTWLVDPPDDNSSSGMISPSGNYVAPRSTTRKTVTITARSVADPTKSARAAVTLEP